VSTIGRYKFSTANEVCKEKYVAKKHVHDFFVIKKTYNKDILDVLVFWAEQLSVVFFLVRVFVHIWHPVGPGLDTMPRNYLGKSMLPIHH
jgi:hypothetical protein